ncbi:MAG: DUF4040 domain-containing protein [Planctomycetales bacterium]|nr:DUF4040 domain-containing protein [Planctomycetales bacterium]
MFSALLGIFALALLAPVASRWLGEWTGWVYSLLPLGMLIHFASHLSAIQRGTVFASHTDWLDSLDLAISLRLDGLSLLFCMLITGIGVFVPVYAQAHTSSTSETGRLVGQLMAFMGAMLGLVLSDNLFCLYVFWELTTLTSFFLIGFNHQQPAARTAALTSLIITSLGGLAMLAGLLLLASTTGSYELSILTTLSTADNSAALNAAIFGLLLVGAMTKSAQFPFHIWLPAAMQAPTAVSAYLHSATMVKAGIYLLARLLPVFGNSEVWLVALTTIGSVTMIVGGTQALFANDLKRVLAFATIAVLGMLVMLIGIGTETAILAMFITLVAHALYKAPLFFAAGAIDHALHTRQLNQLSGLGRHMPFMACASLLAAVSMMGVIPTIGFVSKELVYEVVRNNPWAIALTSLTVTANVLLVAVALRLAVIPFFGRTNEDLPQPTRSSIAEWQGPLVLGISGVLLGLVTPELTARLINPAATNVLGRTIGESVKLWHGFTSTFMLSLLTLALGMAVFGICQRRPSMLGAIRLPTAISPTKIGSYLGIGVKQLSRVTVFALQSGYLRHYLSVILLTIIVGTWWSLLTVSGWPSAWTMSSIRWYEIVLVAAVFTGTLLTVVSHSRLAAITSLGAVGFGVTAIFMLYGALDLAITQFAVETLTVILLVLVFLHLPRYERRSSRRRHFRDAAVAVATGVTITALLLWVQDATSDLPMSREYIARSVSEAHGHNVVNVILVDFRALDTLGEIAVLSAAGVGVHALLKLKPEAVE